MQRFAEYELEEAARKAAKKCEAINLADSTSWFPLVNRQQRKKEADSFEDVAEYLGIYEKEN